MQPAREILPDAGLQVEVVVGPLMMGWVLDLSGGMSPLPGLAFGSVALTMALALVAFAVLRPAELTGDRGAAAAKPAR